MSEKIKFAIQHTMKLMTVLSLTFAAASAFAESTNDTPGKNFPILENSYLLQSFDSSHKATEEPITSNLKSAYFYSNCYDSAHCDSHIPTGATVFNVPSGFGATAHSHFPRVELRAKDNFVNGDIFDNVQTGSVYIVKNPSTKSIIFAQIHGDKPGGSEMFKLRWEDGSIVAGVKEHYGDSEKRTMLLSGLSLHEKVDYKLEAKGEHNQIKVTIEVKAGGDSKKATFTYPKSSWDSIKLYFKAGNYNQDASKGSEAVVAYSALNVAYH